MNVEKGITFDGISDTWIKGTSKINLICDLWNPWTIANLGEKSFEARLIPLNKAYPDIPEAH